MTPEDLAELEELRTRLETAMLTAHGAWSRAELADCISSLDTLLRSEAPATAQVIRMRTRAKSLLAMLPLA